MSREDRLAFLAEVWLRRANRFGPTMCPRLPFAAYGCGDRSNPEGAIPAEVREARAETLKALAACERGWTRAAQLINERGGLRPEPVNLPEQARAKSAEKAARDEIRTGQTVRVKDIA